MGCVKNFNTALEIWLAHNGIANIQVHEGADFCYFYETHKIQWGMIVNEKLDHDFAEYFHEYGVEGMTFDKMDIVVFSFLHEVGHVMTLSNFTEEEMLLDSIFKDDTHDSFEYWDLPVELAANVWAIKWVETHKEEYQALYNLFATGLRAIYDDKDVMEQINDWMDDVMDGDDSDLIIVEDDEEW